jgi:hypothetical protein
VRRLLKSYTLEDLHRGFGLRRNPTAFSSADSYG